MKFVSHDGGDDGEHHSVGLVEISKIFMTQDDFFLWGGINTESIATCQHQLLGDTVRKPHENLA